MCYMAMMMVVMFDGVIYKGGVERAGRTQEAATWRKWRQIVRLLINRRIPQKTRKYFLFSSETLDLMKVDDGLAD